MTIESLPQIEILPEHIIDQIKAGEVIERPSNLVKELLENAVDAQSKHIKVEIINNGMDLISIEDDGIGINPHSLPLAFHRHATSKISRFDDLYRIHSYGFRGEALASIASISKVNCTTYSEGLKGFYQIEGAETISHEVEKKVHPSGTSLFIKDLFYNTPVRIKFIQSKTSESNSLKKVIDSFLVCHPEIQFSIKLNENERKNYPVESQLKDRIKKVHFSNKNVSFLQSTKSYGDIEIDFIATKETTRGNVGKNHFIFVNDRFIQDISMHKIVMNTMARLWPFGESGHYYLFITTKPSLLDVNVHPSKTKIKFAQSSEVFSLLSSTIKELARSSQTSHFDINKSPPSLFDQHQSTREQNLSAREHNFSYSTSETSESNVDFTRENNNRLQILFESPHHFLFSLEENLYLISKSKLLNALLDLQSKESVPLLVSIPLKEVSKNCLWIIEKLKSCGFEIDRVDNKNFLIRSYPEHFLGINLDEFTQSLFEQCELYNMRSINQQMNIKFSSNFVRVFVDKAGLSQLIERSLITLLDDKKLKQWS